jgi:HD-GYP domain-containing protein (c-di-GMP phosphodiesterase class II)
MYVSELDRPWIETPFLFQGFEVRTTLDIEEIKRYCVYVYIDTQPRQDVKLRSFFPERLLSRSERTDKVEQPLPFVPPPPIGKRNQGAHKPFYPDVLSLEEEIQQATEIERETRALISTVMDDARMGRSLDGPGTRKIVGKMVDSIIRNPDALVWFLHLKNKKDEYTAMHSLRVCILALAFGRHLEFPKQTLTVLGIGALLHDVGKVMIPSEILEKPGDLTRDEYEIIKTHVPIGVDILEISPGIPPMAVEFARRHHERYNGSGYIAGLKGNAIGDFGMIGAIIDHYDAMVSPHVYRGAHSSYDALRGMYELRNAEFHAGLVEQFIQCMGIYPIGSIVEMCDASVAVVITTNRTRRLKPRIALVLKPDKTPYQPCQYVDLMRDYSEGPGHSLEIRKVLTAGAFDINPTDYLP